MTKSWKTTLAGVMSIIAGGWGVAQPIIYTPHQPVDPQAVAGSLAAVIAGIGLIFAKDSNVTRTGK